MNYYDEFDLDPSLSTAEIKKQLLKESRKWTTRVNAPDLDRRQMAEKKVKLISEAEKAFKDDSTRAKYDRTLGKKKQEPARGQNISMDWQACIDMAIDLNRQNKGQEAMKYAVMARDMEPRLAESWNVVGIVEEGLDRNLDAIQSYIKALELEPNNLVINNNLGFLYLNLNRIKDARFMADKLMKLDNSYERSIILMSEVLRMEGNYDSSIDILLEVLERDPLNENIKRSLAGAYNSKAFSYCYYNQNAGGYFIVDGDTIPKVVENLTKAKEYYYDPIYDTNIEWANGNYKSEFDQENKKLFIIPAAILLISRNIIGIGLASLVGYIIYRASKKAIWEVNRERFFGEDVTRKKAVKLSKDLFTQTGEKLKDAKEVLDSKIEEESRKMKERSKLKDQERESEIDPEEIVEEVEELKGPVDLEEELLEGVLEEGED